jgi:DNA-binding GntR family transcriptional regulator
LRFCIQNTILPGNCHTPPEEVNVEPRSSARVDAPPRRIARRPLREDVRAELLEWIWRGAVAPGSRVSDQALAADLGVSRTPVREALLRLHREGVVIADPGRGFLIKPLSAAEVRDLYPVLWTLECLALSLSPAPAAPRLRELRRLNREMALAREPETLLELDLGWHAALLSECPNQPLLDLIRSLKERLRRYEHAYMRGVGRVAVSTRQHDQIAAALAKGDPELAARWLEKNWRISLERLTAWLETSEPPASRGSTLVLPTGSSPRRRRSTRR